jgi:hypothetical protein
MRKTRRAKTHFVPQAVYRTAFAGVVPLCVAGIACGGSTASTPPVDGGDDGYANLAVGCTGFCGVAAIGFDSGSDADAAGQDAPSTDAKPDAPQVFAVACAGFCGVGIGAFGDGGDSG